MILHSKVIGAGEPLFILHGLFGQADNWQTLGKVFSEFYEVHLIDQRNHGHSFHDRVFNYEEMSYDLEQYMQSKGIDQAHLLGHSMGGKAAMMFAVSHPKKTLKLIVVDISPKYYPPHHQQILQGLNSIDFSMVDSRKLADEVMASHITIPSVRQFLLKNLYWKEKGKLDWRFNLKDIQKNIEEVGKALPSSAFSDVPSLFVYGQKSDYIIEGDETLIYQHFPNACLEEIPNAGHWIHAENPKDFMSSVLRFLKDE